MKLDYKILWLDDKMDVIIEDQYQDQIEQHLLDQGFNPVIVMVDNETEFFKELDDSFDLILTDYHLNSTKLNSRDGDEIIKLVRSKSIFTEIMFYSAQGEVVDTIKLDRITFVDTRKIIGSNHYEKIIAKAIDLIDLTIKKFQHIVVMRGMIMSETSILDMQMLNLIKLALTQNNIPFDDLAESIYDEICELYRQKTSFVDTCRQKKKFKLLTTDNFVFSADYKIKTLSQILNSIGLDDFSESYSKEINSIRNKFAHAVLSKDPSTGREYFKHGDSGMTFDDDLCKKIRKDISKHKENFNELSRKMSVE